MQKNILILLLFTTSSIFGQTHSKKSVPLKSASCDFIFEADSSMNGKDFKLVSFLLDGNCDVSSSSEMRSQFTLLLQSKVTVSKKYFADQLKKICFIHPCVLEKVGIYRMSVPGEVMLILTYNEKK